MEKMEKKKKKEKKDYEMYMRQLLLVVYNEKKILGLKKSRKKKTK